MSDLAISPAEPAEYPAVLQILFQRAADEVRGNTIDQAVHMLSRGVLDPRGLLVARRAGRPVGAMLSTAAPGSVGLVWPPQVREVDGRAPIEDALVGASLAWMTQSGVKLAQALLSGAEVDLGPVLERNGFRHITRLLFLLRTLDNLPPDAPGSLTFQPFPSVDASVFAATMRRTYRGTLDCPEVEGVRTMEEILAGYRSQDGHDPARWWLVKGVGSLFSPGTDEPTASGGRAKKDSRPLGVLLTNRIPEEPAWEILYVGVVPEARGRGLGRLLIQFVLAEAKSAGMEAIKLAVDRRNEPALRLYKRLEFQIWDEREVFLADISK